MSLDFDLGVTDQKLDTSGGLSTPILISLMTHARAHPDDLVPDDTDLKGWWGDPYLDPPGTVMGSRLWTLWGQSMSVALTKAEGITRDALQWMIVGGLVSRFDIELSAVTPVVLGIKIGVVRPGATLVSWLGPWEISLAG